MENEMRNSSQIDEAFKAIKTATGVTDVQEMVKRFLTREQTYSALLINVSESDAKMDRLKKQNDELRARVHELKIDSESIQNSTQDSMNKFQDDDIISAKETITTQQKEYQNLHEKYKKINIVNDQISGWSKRVYGKFAALTDESDLKNPSGDDIVKIFAGMEEITVTELSALKARADKNPVEPDDAFIDFATEDFINKNIRVRPISGVTNKDETRDGRASNVSGQRGADGGEDAVNNSDNMAKYEMENQRKLAKRKYQDYQDELRRKQALEEKKNQKK